MAPNKITNNFLKRFTELGAYLKTADVKLKHFETFDPVEEESIKFVEEDLNIKLDETFLAYFRESDGYELQYTFGDENREGAIMIPAFESIFNDQMETYGKPGEYLHKTLGGRDDFEMRSNMYRFDRFTEDMDGLFYNSIYYLVTDDVLLQTNDYNASITDSHPITIPSYFELCLATAGLKSRRKMLTQIADSNYEIVDFTREDYDQLYPWSNSISLAKKGLVSKGFYDLTNLVTKEKGYDFRFMKWEEEDS